MITAYRKLLAVTGRGRTFLLLLSLRAPFTIVSIAINAEFLRRAFDAIARGDTAALHGACAAFAVASLCLYLYNGIVWGLYAPFGVRMEGTLRRKLCAKIVGFPLGRIEATPHGEWLTRLNIDAEEPFSRAVHLPHAACAVFSICVSAVVLWRAQPQIFLWVMLFVAPHIAVSQLLIARAMPGLRRKALEATADNTGDLTAFIACADAAALYDAHGLLLRKFERSSLALLRAELRMRLRGALSEGILPLFGGGGYLALLFAMSGPIADGAFTFGDLTSAFSYRGGVLVGALSLIRCMVSIRASMAGIGRINETMAEKAGEDDG